MKKLTRINLDSLAARLPVLDEQEQRAILGGNSGASTGSYTGGIDPTDPTGVYGGTGVYVDPTGVFDGGTGTGAISGDCSCIEPTGYFIVITGEMHEDGTVDDSTKVWVAAEELECTCIRYEMTVTIEPGRCVQGAFASIYQRMNGGTPEDAEKEAAKLMNNADVNPDPGTGDGIIMSDDSRDEILTSIKGVSIFTSDPSGDGTDIVNHFINGGLGLGTLPLTGNEKFVHTVVYTGICESTGKLEYYDPQTGLNGKVTPDGSGSFVLFNN